MTTEWQKGIKTWYEGERVCVSVVFTWQLPTVKKIAELYSERTVLVGGPAVRKLPEYLAGLANVETGRHYPGMLQRFNPQATRTSTGCIRKCKFCGVPGDEGPLQELEDWPDLPVICDNNLLACSQAHFDRVLDRLVKHGWADYNQGLDVRLLKAYHAQRIAEVKRGFVRLALDHLSYADQWERAFDLLRTVGIAKHRIRTYCIVAFTTGPEECWERCNFIQARKVKAFPMWFHELDALQHNTVTDKQAALGWNDYEYRRIMQWFYQHKKAVA